jgi:hypothetical protein
MKRFLLLFVLAALIATPVALACPGCGKHAEAASSKGHDCSANMKGVEKTVTNTDNGARIEMTASDPEMVKTLQAHVADESKKGCGPDCPMANAAWSHKVENTDKGVVVTLTASSKDDVAKLQTAVAEMAKGGCMKTGEAGGCNHKAGAKATKA